MEDAGRLGRSVSGKRGRLAGARGERVRGVCRGSFGECESLSDRDAPSQGTGAIRGEILKGLSPLSAPEIRPLMAEFLPVRVCPGR